MRSIPSAESAGDPPLDSHQASGQLSITKDGAKDGCRPRRHVLVIGVVYTTCSAAMALLAVTGAYFDTDTEISLARRTTMAAFACLVMSAFGAFSSGWIAAYFRERLVLGKTAIVHQGIFRRRVVDPPSATRIKWRRNAVIVIRTASTRIAIDLDKFTTDEQEEIICFLRATFKPDIQHGWQKFHEARLAMLGPRKRSPGAAAICAIMLIVFGNLLVLSWLQGLGLHWLPLSVANILGGLWYIWRIIVFRDRPSEGQPAVDDPRK
ncbi:MAG: hypothetical protein QGG36_15370 [Pirellulaceae bacterium]|jgi:hypothetical protein|nr:hypothetical protein [Pirellulaceae bacterium]